MAPLAAVGRDRRLAPARAAAALLAGLFVLVAVPAAAQPRSTTTPLDEAVATDSLVVELAPAAVARPAAEVTTTLEAVTAHAGVTAEATPVALPGWVHVTVADGDLEAALAALDDDPRVRSVSPEPVARAAEVAANDPLWDEQWGARRVRAPEAWEVTRGSPGVVVAVLDTGVDVSHPDLAGAFVRGRNFVEPGTAAVDRNGHGTEVVGILAARQDNNIGGSGICPRCRVMVAKVLDDQGFGILSDIADGIVWATNSGADVINLSLSTSENHRLLRDAITYARTRDVVVVAAAGNGELLGSASPTYPAAYSGVLGVAASDGNDRRAQYSNYGSWVAVAAPGCNLGTTLGGATRWLCGTSSAAPVVAGIAGLVRSAAPLASRARVEAALLDSARTVVGGYVSAGRVDAWGALREAGSLIDVGSWAGWAAVASDAAGPPGATVSEGSRIDVFTASQQGPLLHRALDDSDATVASQSPESIEPPDPGAASGAPAVISREEGQFNLVVRGPDNALWHRWYAPWRGWSEWQSLGGFLTSDPALASWSPVHLVVFARGGDGALWERTYLKGWQPWRRRGGRLSSAPAAVSWGPDRIDVFAKGTDRALWHVPYARGRWWGWNDLGGVLHGAGRPGVTSWAEGRLDVFVVGTSQRLHRRTYGLGLGWSPRVGFEALGGPGSPLESGLAAVTYRPGQVDVFARNSNGRLWRLRGG